jgi:hypothetical protein
MANRALLLLLIIFLLFFTETTFIRNQVFSSYVIVSANPCHKQSSVSRMKVSDTHTALKRCRATESLWNKWLISCMSDVAMVMRRPSSDRKEAALCYPVCRINNFYLIIIIIIILITNTKYYYYYFYYYY